MSSCGAFYFICSLAASCASATSAFSPTAGAPACCPSASNSCAVPRKKWLQQRRHPRITPAAVGVARCAVEPCTRSNGSQPHNSCSVLHHWPSGAQHELAYKTRSLGVLRNAQGTLASSRAAASADTDPNCCQPPRPGTAHRISRLDSANKKRKHGIRSTASSHRPRSKCIGAHRGGFLQVALSEVPTLQQLLNSVLWALQIQPKDFPVGIRFEHGLDDHP